MRKPWLTPRVNFNPSPKVPSLAAGACSLEILYLVTFFLLLYFHLFISAEEPQFFRFNGVILVDLPQPSSLASRYAWVLLFSLHSPAMLSFLIKCRVEAHSIIKASPAVCNQLTAADGWATNQIIGIRLEHCDLIAPPLAQQAQPNCRDGLLAC